MGGESDGWREEEEKREREKKEKTERRLVAFCVTGVYARDTLTMLGQGNKRTLTNTERAVGAITYTTARWAKT